MKKKSITVKQAIRLAGKFGVKLNKNSFDNISNGEFLFKRLNEETGKETFYFLQKYFKQSFNFRYSCRKGGDVGKELIMSNIPMPNIRKFL